jgi:hypothetical protein
VRRRGNLWEGVGYGGSSLVLGSLVLGVIVNSLDCYFVGCASCK